MLWIERDGGGQVKGVYGIRQPGYADEMVAEEHPDVVAFRTALANRIAQTELTQAEKIAALEARVEGLESRS